MFSDLTIEPRLVLGSGENAKKLNYQVLPKKIDDLDKIFLVGPPGVGKTTLLQCLAAEIECERFVSMNQLLNPSEFLMDYEWEEQNGRLIIDGLEDSELGIKTLKRVIWHLSFFDFPFIVSVRQSLWDQLYCDEFESIFSIVSILEWTREDVTEFFNGKNIQNRWALECNFISTPFYANLASSLCQADKCDSKYSIIDHFFEKEITAISEETDTLKRDIYVFFESLSFSARKSGSKSVPLSVFYSLLVKCNLPERSIEISSLLLIDDVAVRFKHELFLEFIIAKNLFQKIYFSQDIQSFGMFQTSYEEDEFIASQVGNSPQCINIFIRYANTIDDSILKVNILGMLAKIPGIDADLIWPTIEKDNNVYGKYKNAIFERLGIFETGEENNIMKEKALRKERKASRDPVARLICEKEINLLIGSMNVSD